MDQVLRELERAAAAGDSGAVPQLVALQLRAHGGVEALREALSDPTPWTLPPCVECVRCGSLGGAHTDCVKIVPEGDLPEDQLIEVAPHAEGSGCAVCDAGHTTLSEGLAAQQRVVEFAEAGDLDAAHREALRAERLLEEACGAYSNDLNAAVVGLWRAAHDAYPALIAPLSQESPTIPSQQPTAQAYVDDLAGMRPNRLARFGVQGLLIALLAVGVLSCLLPSLVGPAQAAPY